MPTAAPRALYSHSKLLSILTRFVGLKEEIEAMLVQARRQSNWPRRSEPATSKFWILLCALWADQKNEGLLTCIDGHQALKEQRFAGQYRTVKIEVKNRRTLTQTSFRF